MKPLKPAFRNAAFAVAFVAILVAADLASGVDLLQQLPLPSSASALRRFQQDVERLWQGGGGQVLFADDFSTYTADWLARQGAGLPGYHGGALPESGDSPARWAQDLYRWGHAATALASADGWSMEHDGYTQFGDPAVGYPAGVQSELVSPVIDLRGLPAYTEDAEAKLSANPDPLGYNSRQCPPSDNLAAVNVYGCAVAEEGTNVTAALGFSHGYRTVGSPVREASAALRVRHAYGFRVDSNTGLMDGGRLVVATLDPGTHTWTPWVGVDPSDRVLQLDGEQMRVRRDPADPVYNTTPIEVRARHDLVLESLLAGNPSAAAEVIVGDRQNATVDSQDSLPANQAMETRDLDPHLYQGPIAASGAAGHRWEGFGGDSGGMVDSIFDLSRFAGRLIRVGFQVATSPGDEPLVAEAGWRLDELEVHAVGSPTIQVVGLAQPGDGAAIPPGSDVRPTLILQNTGADPVEVVASTTAGDEGGSQRTRLSVGPLGRVHLQTGVAFTDIETGLVPVDVAIRPVAEANGAAQTDVQRPDATTAHFHFLAAEASGWQAGRPGFYPDGVPREKAAKLVVRGQRANITVELENTGTLPRTIALGASWLAANGSRQVTAGDLRPIMVDESGMEYGTMTPVETAVALPVSRAVAGTLGTPMAARVATWQWSGSDVARALRLQVVDANRQLLRNGGDVMVQTVPPNPLDIDFSNRWNFAAGATACTRLEEWGGQQGVVQCPAGQGRVVSAVRRLFEIDLFRGNETHLLVSYRGGAVNASIQAVQAGGTAPDPLPPANAVWQTLGHATLPATGAWKTVVAPGPRLPASFVGHVRLVLESVDGSAFDLDEAGLYLTLRNSHGSEVSVPVVADRFDVTLLPSRDVILPTQPSGLVVLDGIDESTGQTRFLEDSVLTLEQPIDLAGLGRPSLTFRHWVDTGFHGTATVEVAPASTLQAAAPAVADASAGTAGGWRVLARYNGTDTGRSTVPATLSLWEYAGQSIVLRFRFHIDPTILTAEVDGVSVFPGYPPNPNQLTTLRRTQDATPIGWLIEGVDVTAWGPGGSQVVHRAAHGFLNYTLQGGHFVDDTEGHPLSHGQNCWDSTLRLNSACANDSRLSRPRGESSLVSEPMVLDNMDEPVLTLVHSGTLSRTPCGFGTTFPAVDVDYQRMAGGIPAGPWNPGTPTEGFTWPRDWYSQVGWRRTDQSDALPLRTPAGDLHGPPFAGTHPLEDQNGCFGSPSTSKVPQAYAFDIREDAFDLSPLKPMEEGGRIRLDVWSERGYPPGNAYLVTAQNIGKYDIASIRVAESKQFIDAKVESITTALDDRARLQQFAPTVAQALGVRDQVVLAQDVATFAVKVTNVGQADLEVDVSLRAAPLVGDAPIDITWMEDLGSSLRAAGVPTGHVAVPKGGSVDVIFQANFLEAPPGGYRLAARVDATTGVDTAPSNDLHEQDLLLIPFRRVEMEPGQSFVAPFAAEASATRTIQATVANQGNVDEGGIRLRADVVRMTGLTAFEPLNPPVEPRPLGAATLSLGRRGDGRTAATWTLGPEDLPLGADLNVLFPPGQKYAVRIRADPAPDSVKAWWPPLTGTPLAERTDGTGLLNLTAMPGRDCSCLLVPFLVERLLYGTDFSPRNSTSVLPQVLPVDTVDHLMGGWAATTVVDGTPLTPTERPDIPRWKRATAAEAAATFPGAPTGNAWVLPAYEGLEDIQQVLESPPLPSHIVKGTSRSILAMTYASGVPQGQAVLETRSLVGGEWTPWRPIDAMRSERVAIVLAYDFPRVTPTGLGNDTVVLGDLVLTGAQGGTLAATGLKGVPLRDGGVSRFCYSDVDGGDDFDANEPAYLAADCIAVAAGDVRLANPPPGASSPNPVGSQVGAVDPDVGRPLQESGYALAMDGPRWVADMDGSGTQSIGDIVLVGDASQPRGTVLSSDLGGTLVAGALHRAFIDNDHDGAYGPGDTVLLHNPLLTVANQYNGALLRSANHPAPSWYNDPPSFSNIKHSGAAGPNDQAPVCNWSDTTSLPLCAWSPPLRFDAAGNEAWVDALNEALNQLARRLGTDNIGLFSTVQPGGELAIGHWENGTLVHTVRDGVSTRRFAIRDLDALGVDLDHYGAILLMGDGTTKAFATESPALQSLRHGPGDTADPNWLPPAEQALAKLHHDRLFAILNAAAPAGIRVVGALGPAAATLARSGAVPDASMTVWQTFRYMPNVSSYAGTSNLYCTGVKPSPTTPTYQAPAPGAQHPLAPCRTKIGGTNVVPDTSDHHNYRLLSPYDQQSLFLREMVERNGEASVAARGAHFPAPASIFQCPLGDSTPEHPFLGTGSSTCERLSSVKGDSVGPLTVLTASRPEDVDNWVDQVGSVLELATGELPSGGWQPLPPNLSFPIGGRFVRRADGSDAFDGSPTQVRIRVLGDETTGGHGPFAVDRIALLGSNRTAGIGVAFAAPVDGRPYAPGKSFDVAVQATNRGVNATRATQATVTMERWDRDGCSVTPWEPVTVTVPPLQPGAQATLPVYAGLFPDGPACPRPALQQSLYNLTVRLAPGWSDDDPRDDQQGIQVLGRETAVLDASAVADFKVTPTRSTFSPDLAIDVAATVRNLASNRQTFRMDVVLEHARPLACLRHDNPADPDDDDLYGCTPKDSLAFPIPLPRSAGKNLDIASGESDTLHYTVTPAELGIAAGLYRVSVRLHVTDNVHVLTFPPEGERPLQRLVRLTTSSDPAEARAALPPDGAFGFESNDLDALWARGSVPAQPSPTAVWDPAGVQATNEGMFPGSAVTPNNGAYAPDPTTRDATGMAISHGWRIVGCADPASALCPTDSTRSYLEWKRDGSPSYRKGMDLAKWDQSTGTPDDYGYGDFGPDTLSWLPQNPVDQRSNPASRIPYLSLASYDTPTLSFLTHFDGSPNTAFVVEMQVAQRIPCTPASQTSPHNNCNNSGWNWNTPALPLKSVEPQGVPLPAQVMSEVFATRGPPPKLGSPPMYWNRYTPSNPLAGEAGFWGQASQQHAEDGGWVRIHIPLTEAMQQGMTAYCRASAASGTMGETQFRLEERNPCAYAHASDGDNANGGETYVARPVRFRFRAASYGGDAGESAWQVADLSLSDHRLRFLGPPQVSVTMNDEETRVVPVRIANTGSLPDRVEVAWAPTRGHTPTLGTNGSIALSTMPDLRDAAERLTLDLAPGQSRVVWVRIHTGILGAVNPGSVQHIPFLVQARSLIDPVQVEEVLVDAKFTTHAWPDLVATKLVLGESAAQGGLFEGSLHSPLKATLVFRNVGELAIGSPAQPIRVSLVAQELDENGTVVPGTRQVVDQQQVATSIAPQRQDSSEHFVNFGEWLPDRLGLFQLSAELNAPGNGPALPESSRGNNAVARLVAVGPIRFADLNITDLWAVEFHGTCGEERVERLVAGHAYCLAARVENHGLRSALDPRVDFGVGASAPFSSGAPSLSAMVGGVFPAAETLGELPAKVVLSSPRAIVAPPASSSGLVFYAEASSRSLMPNFDGKLRKLTLPVDVYQIAVGLDAHAADISPGREVRIPITLGNRGNAPATAGISLAGDAVADLEIRLDGVRTLLPGENATVTLTLAAGRQLDANAHIGALALTVAEDSRALIPLALKVNVADGGLPDAQALSLWAAPGAANATLVLDAASSPVPYLWHAESVKGPLRADAGWEAETQPFDRQVVSVPLTIAATAAPGTVQAPLRLVAEHDGVEVLVPLNVTLEVAPRPALTARLVLDHRTAAPGAQAAFALQLNNTGNVPLSPRVLHRVDLGAVTPDDQAATLLPGQGALLPFTALAGPFPRALGQTEVAWSTPGGRAGNLTLPWRLDVLDARFEIAGGLPDLHPTAGQTSQVQVPVLNAGSGPAEAEVLLAVDGVLQSRRTVTLDPGEVRQVALPFKAGPSGARQDLEVLVRPVGSDAWLGDAALYDAGDVGSAKVEPVAGSSLPIPGLELLAALGACLAVAAARRRRA